MSIFLVNYHLNFRYLWEQMLEAVQEVHDHNIIHADLKPGNFLLVTGQLKVIDFGLAIDLQPGSDFAVRQFIGGTKEYMSPETLAGYIIEHGEINRDAMSKSNGVKVSFKSDIWALGIILYHTVYGDLPFSSVPGGRTAKIQALADPNTPVEFDNTTNIDPLLLDTMKRCLQKSPEKRATIKELLNHPYLRPDLAADTGSMPSSRICNVCKSRENKLAKMTKKRLEAFTPLK